MLSGSTPCPVNYPSLVSILFPDHRETDTYRFNGNRWQRQWQLQSRNVLSLNPFILTITRLLLVGGGRRLRNRRSRRRRTFSEGRIRRDVSRNFSAWSKVACRRRRDNRCGRPITVRILALALTVRELRAELSCLSPQSGLRPTGLGLGLCGSTLLAVGGVSIVGIEQMMFLLLSLGLFLEGLLLLWCHRLPFLRCLLADLVLVGLGSVNRWEWRMSHVIIGSKDDEGVARAGDAIARSAVGLCLRASGASHIGLGERLSGCERRRAGR